MEREDDVQLIHAVLSGDDAAFDTLVEKHQKSVHALAWRKIGDFHYAEEITQDTFLRAYQNLSTLRNPSQFLGWLYVIANRLCLNWLRKHKPANQLQSLEDTPMEEVAKSAYAHYVLEQREIEATEHRFEIVKKLLEKLPESERTVMTLYYLGEMTTKEIGKFLGVSVETIRTRMHRARKRLQEEEKLLVQEVLGGVQISANIRQNIMREVVDMKPTPSPKMEPFLPWMAFGAAVVVATLLMLSVSNQYLTRFQKPYSFEVESEPTVEIIDAPTVLETNAKPALRNQIGRAVATAGNTSSNGLQVSERSSTLDATVPSEDTQSWMPDPALRTAIREALTLPDTAPLTKEKMRELHRLKLGGKGITDITGLEFAQNLVNLELGNQGNNVTDLTPLATLTALTGLNVGGNQVTDLRPLANLTNLKGLSLWNNHVTDVSSLRSLTGLTYLNLAANHVSDLNPLANLVSLEKLDLYDNEVEGITPLSDLKNLNFLILKHNRIRNLNPLIGLTELRVLRIEENPIRDLTPLYELNLTDLKYDAVPEPAGQTDPSEAWMPDRALRAAVRGEIGILPDVPLTKEQLYHLQHLNANHKGIRNIAGLEFATNLRELYLGRNPITDLRPLANLTQLEILHLWSLTPDTPGLDLRPLTGLIDLEELSLGRNRISGISPLANLKKLRTLNLSHNDISDLRPLTGLKKLRTLNLPDNGVSDLRPLVELTQLQTLWINENPVTNFTLLFELNLTALKYDAVPDPEAPTQSSKTWMPDPALRAAIRGELGLLPGVPLTKEKMLKLEYLYAEGKGIRNITGLGFAANLKELHLNKNPITDLRPLVNLTNLEILHIQDLAPTTANLDIRPLGDLINLKTLTLQRNGISDISPLTGLMQLRTLGIEGNPITDLSPLFRLDITELDLSNNPLTDLRQLVNLTSLEYLCLEKSQISDINPLGGLKRLRILDIRYNAIENLQPLAELVTLRRLWIQGNPIRDFSPLSGLSLTDFRYDEP